MISETLNNLLFFGITFGLTIIMFSLAVSRKTIVPSVFSMTLWYALAFSVWTFADPTVAFTQVASLLFFMFGVLMTVFSLMVTFQHLEAVAEEKKRAIAEDVV